MPTSPRPGRPWTRRRVLAASAVGGTALVLGARPASAAAATYRPTFARVAYDGNPAAAGTQRWPWQVLQADLRRPTAAQAPTQLAYATAVVRSSDPDGITQCLRPAAVASSWLLRTTSGSVVTRAGGDRAVDVGVSGFRQAATSALVARCRAGGWTGIYLDEVNADLEHGWPGARSAKYPTDASWRAAQLGFVTQLAAGLRAGGFTLVGNLGQFVPDHEPWHGQLLDAGLVPSCEVFLHGYDRGGVPLTGGDWEYEVGVLQRALRSGTRVLVHERQDDPARVRYALCSVLLVDDGLAVFGSDIEYSTTTSLYPADYSTAIALGGPSGQAYEPDPAVAPGLFARDFTAGHVVVNSTAATVRTGGYTFPAASGTFLRR